MSDADPTRPVLAPSPTEAALRRRRGQRGQSMVEYAFILMLIAIALLVAVQVLSNHTASLYTNISDGLRNASG